MKLFEFFTKLKRPKLPQSKPEEPKRRRLLKLWRKFKRQIPREFRSHIKTHQPFVLIGDKGSGKSELVNSIVEQSQNIYPFEVEYTEDPQLQFYLGPKQIVQEISLDLIKDRTIKLRRSIIQLWKHLFSKNTPVVVIAHNCWLDSTINVKEINKTARLISGKISLLSDLCKEPIRVRIALTHLDKIDGYLEFARFIKQHNIAFEIPLTTNFEYDTLVQSLLAFRDHHLSLILTTTSAANYTKILNFFSELPKLFSSIEEFLRILTTGNDANHLQLESLAFSSSLEAYTSYVSFDWVPEKRNSIFNRHPMLKHQLAAAAIVIVSFTLIFNNFFKDRKQIALSQKSVNSLTYSPENFVEEVIPKIESLNKFRPTGNYISLLPRFYKKKLNETNLTLAAGIRENILEPKFRRFLLENSSELHTIYMLGLIHATNDNPLGERVLKNIASWSKVLHLDPKLIKFYIESSDGLRENPINIEHLEQISCSTPLSDLQPWMDFLREFQVMISQPVFAGHDFDQLRLKSEEFLGYYHILTQDPNARPISALLKATSAPMLATFQKNVDLLSWIKEDGDLIEGFLNFLNRTCVPIPDVTELNISQFFAKLKSVAEITEQESRSFPFVVNGEKMEFSGEKWLKIATSHIIERMLHSYMLVNKDSHGDIFFKGTPPIADLIFDPIRHEFPYFDEPFVIDGRYTRMGFEVNVRGISESLIHLLEEMPVSPENQARFKQFIQHEVVGYAKEYQQHYERLYAACNIPKCSYDEIEKILENSLKPSSHLEYVLSRIAHHTEVFSNESTTLEILDRMNHFTFLQTLMGKEKSEDAPFGSYQKILGTALADLKNPHAMKIGPDFMTRHFSPYALIAHTIKRGDPDSYINQILATLQEAEVPEDYHSFFIKPILRVYELGVKDLETGINKMWAASVNPLLSSLFSKRPFNPDGDIAATFEEVKNITSPTSPFFATLKELVEPVSQFHQGNYTQDASSDLVLSDEIYANFNRLTNISTNIWDLEGNPKPLSLTIQSLPFESREKTYPTPIISYLVTGTETFHNFNQSPTWHTIKVEWWKENSSSVVMEFASKNNSRSYDDEKVTTTLWSFFELLKKAKSRENNIWTWKLKSPTGGDINHVALQFQNDPWNYFQAP